MVQIPTYEARVGLDAPSYPVPRVDDSAGQALRSAGSAIASLGDHIKQKEKRTAAFNTAISYDRLNEELSQGLTEAERNAPANGQGLHDTFVDKTVTPKTDAFLSSIQDPDLKKEYEARLGLLRDKWSNDAANKQYGISNGYSQNAVNDAWKTRAQGIADNPVQVAAYTEEMNKLIDNAPDLTSVQREEMKRKVQDSAPGIVAEALKQRDPETFYFATGNGTHDERIAFLLKRVTPSLKMAENAAGDPNAVSKKGAIGLMQVTPGAAITVAEKLGDKAFLALSPEQQIEALKDPATNEKFGTAYLELQLRKYGGDVEATLIAYNAGPGNADKWLAAGRDYAALPKRSETEPYVNKIMDAMGTAKLASGPATNTEVSSSGRIAMVTGTQEGRQPLDTTHLNKNVVDLWERTQGAFGRAVPVVSGFRDPKTNALAGGAKGSQHMHGNAIDVDVSNMSKADRVRLIETASAAGFTGIGIYKNSLHFDTGGRRTWGPTRSSGSEPMWAKAAVMKHMSGTSKPLAGPPAGQMLATKDSPVPVDGNRQSGFVSSAFATMPVANLFEAKASAADLRVKAVDQQRQEKEQRAVESANLVSSDLTSIAQTGKGAIAPTDFETTSAKILETLGPQKHDEWLQSRQIIQRTYDLTADTSGLSNTAMRDRLLQIKPKGGPTAAMDQEVYNAVAKRYDEEMKLRVDDPGLAVQQVPEIKATAATMDWSQPAKVQEYLGQVEAAQAMLQIPDRNLLPKAQAEQLGVQFRNVLRANAGSEAEATKAFLDKLQSVYGNYADDIFTQSYETILEKDISKETKSIMSSVVLDWAQDKPGMIDQRLAVANELAAADKQPDLVEPQPQGRSLWGWLTGAPPVEAPKPAAPKPAAPQAPPRTVTPITIDGVPPDAIDAVMKNPNSMKIQSMFRNIYGADRLKSMQDQLRAQGIIAAQ